MNHQEGFSFISRKSTGIFFHFFNKYLLASTGAWIWPQTKIKSKEYELKPTLLSLWLYFLQVSHLTPGVSSTNWSRVPLHMHKDRHVRALWFMWWGAGNLFPGAVRVSRRDECREPRRAGGFGGFFCFWGVWGLLVPPMVAENYLSRNLKAEAEGGKKGVRV